MDITPFDLSPERPPLPKRTPPTVHNLDSPHDIAHAVQRLALFGMIGLVLAHARRDDADV
ncbi:hypothetical protein GTW20_18140 [Nocardiopsis alba]|uniref:Uncharacterized protein n=1 Tax=Nocardiopsis alba TaxID=53437 RepID=A0A7K2IVZ2_9ACTN|nr:hypothetical protein [Nocardiopsis alba]MYR34121.1 hypothetical protein [Nocardiopsis alba]